MHKKKLSFQCLSVDYFHSLYSYVFSDYTSLVITFLHMQLQLQYKFV